MLLMSGRNDARRLRGVILSQCVVIRERKHLQEDELGCAMHVVYCQTIIVFILSCP